MPARPAFVIHAAAFYGLMVCEVAEMTRLAAAIENLALNEIRRGDFSTIDGLGYRAEARRVGHWVILFVPESADAPLQIVNILQI